MSVIDLAKAREEREPHVAGELFCLGCDHTWSAVWKPGTTEFECPQCHAMRGRSRYDVGLADGTHVWSCKGCGNQLFNLTPDRVHCPGCGNQWGYEELVS